MIIEAPVARPEIPKTSDTLCILTLDGSQSMTEKILMGSTKAEEVDSGVLGLYSRFNASRMKQNLSFACIKFDDTPTVVLNPTKFDITTLMKEDYNPAKGKGGGTHTYAALETAKQMAETFLNGAPKEGVPHQVVILLMTDGECAQPQRTIDIANQIKANPKVQIACAFFGKVGVVATDAQNMLKQVASNATFYTTVYDGETLRTFFERSVSK